MNKFVKLFALLLFVIFTLHFIAPKKPYIKKSKINGNGLFSPKDYKKGDIIISNLFPKKDDNVSIFNPIETKIFNYYIINEGKYINHCSVNYNTDIVSKDHKRYQLIAIKDIKKDEELTNNYDLINKKFPFIGRSNEGYQTC